MKYTPIALILGVVIGIAGMLYLPLAHPNPEQSEPVEEVSVVFNRVTLQNELVTASQDYLVTDKSTDELTLLGFTVPLTKTDLWYRCAGTIKVAVDLSKAELISSDGQVIRIRLEEPYISSNTPDLDKSGTIANYEGWFNPTRPEDVDLAQKTISVLKGSFRPLKRETSSTRQRKIRLPI